MEGGFRPALRDADPGDPEVSSRWLDFMHRRDRSEHLASPEVALVARGGWGGSVKASGPQN